MMQQWYRDGKLGISLHWGIYAVNGIPESWSFFRGQISYEAYMAQCKGFTARNYDPVHWAEVFRHAGAKYTVLTSKHHDGVALWDTKYSDRSVAKMTPAGRDLIGPYCAAMRDAGLKVGLYFSHLDWSEPSYRSMYHYNDLDEIARGSYVPSEFKDPPDGRMDYDKWQEFLKFHRGQLQELMTNYGTIDLLAFDGDWERTALQWDMKGLREFLHRLNPNVVLNSRMCGYGDYETPEQGIPVVPYENKVWEYWFTTNDSWGIQFQDKHYKSLRQIIQMFCDCIGMGGNMLWNVAPLEDGTIDPVQEQLLLDFGDWLTPNAEAVYGTVAGLPFGHYQGASTLSADGQSLYLFFHHIPQERIPVKGLYNAVKRITVLKTGRELEYDSMGGAPWMNIPGTLWIDLPADCADDRTTVLKLELDGPMKLYRGAGQAITAN